MGGPFIGSAITKNSLALYSGASYSLVSGASVMAIDPVCYTVIDEETAAHNAKHKDTTYFFCTASCKKKFMENPEKYAKLTTTITIEPGASC